MHCIRLLNVFFPLGILLIGSGLAPAQEAKAPSLTSPAMLRISRLQPDGQFNAEEFRIYKATHGKLVTSSNVLRAALRNPEVTKLPVVDKWGDNALRELRKSTTVKFPGEAELMTIAVEPTDMSGEQAAKLTNAVMEVYIAEVVNAERLEEVAERDRLDQTLQKYKEDLRKQRFTAYKLRREFQSSAGAVERQVRSQWMSDLLQHIVKLEEERLEPDDHPPAGKKEADARRAKIDQELAELKAQLERQSRAADRAEKYSADIEQIQDDIAVLKEITGRLARQTLELDLAVRRPPRIMLVQKAEP